MNVYTCVAVYKHHRREHHIRLLIKIPYGIYCPHTLCDIRRNERGGSASSSIREHAVNMYNIN